MATDQKYPIFKIILVGDIGTGKTSFLTQLIHRVPQRLPKPTTHLSVFTMRTSKPPKIVQIWDSPGDTKYYYQTLGSIKDFDCILIFVDVTNQYTYERARLFAEQIQGLTYQKQVHIVQSKAEVADKDILKRKVTKAMLRKIVNKFKGGIFTYRQNQNVQDILQNILEWKEKSSQILERQIKLQQNEPKMPHQIKFTAQQITPSCSCILF